MPDSQNKARTSSGAIYVVAQAHYNLKLLMLINFGHTQKSILDPSLDGGAKGNPGIAGCGGIF
jgi:hypothetical protein